MVENAGVSRMEHQPHEKAVSHFIRLVPILLTEKCVLVIDCFKV